MASPVTLLSDYPAIFLVLSTSFLVSFVATALAYYIARKYRVMPDIRQRDVHTERKPRVGGVAMWCTVMLMFGYVSYVASAGLLDFHPTNKGVDPFLWGIMGGLVVVLVTGLLDDIYSLSPGKQLLGQVVASLALVTSGIGITFIRLPFNGELRFDSWTIPSIHLLDGSILMPLSALFTIFWVVLVINVLNFFDGLDGLAGSISFTTSIVLLLVSMKFDYIATATLSLIVMGTSVGFLPWNWFPSKLFMGTVGSQLLGFLLAVIAIVSGAKVATAMLVLGLPLFDAVFVVVSRLRAHKNPFQADRRHLHHRLLSLGMPTPYVVLFLNGIALLFGVLALSTQESTVKGYFSLLLLAVMGGIVGVVWKLEHRRLAELGYTR